MRNMRGSRVFPFLILLAAAILQGPGTRASAETAALNGDDLKLFYNGVKTMELFATPYDGFTKLTGNGGRWEDANRLHYTWGDGQAGFIKIAGMKNPQLAQLVLNEGFRTPRGIVKGSSLEELLQAYPEGYAITEAIDGRWYEYRWRIAGGRRHLNGKDFLLSFYVENGLVASIMLKLEGKETEAIPVG